MAPKVLVVVLAYNRVELTLACLTSLARREYEQSDVLLVDNGSRDGTPAAARAHFPGVGVIETGANLGYAGGNNVGLRYALERGYDYALLLNNDTEVAPDCLHELVAVAEADPAIGLAGPTITYFDRPDTIWSAGGTLDRRRGSSTMRGLNQPLEAQSSEPAEVDFLTGCALLCKRPVLERAGLLDERFFLYYEDAEWCVRARRAGFRVVHAPRARVLHKIPPDGRAAAPYVGYYMARNRLLFLRATGAPPPVWLRAILLQDLRTCLSWSLRPKWRGKRGQRDALLAAWRDFALGRFGRRVAP